MATDGGRAGDRKPGRACLSLRGAAPEDVTPVRRSSLAPAPAHSQAPLDMAPSSPSRCSFMNSRLQTRGFVFPVPVVPIILPSITKHLAQIFITVNAHTDVAFGTQFSSKESVFHTEPNAILQTHLYGPINVQEGCQVLAARQWQGCTRLPLATAIVWIHLKTQSVLLLFLG